VAEVRPTLRHDQEAAATRLRQEARELAAAGQVSLDPERFAAARRQVLTARLEAARWTLRPLVEKDQFQAAAEKAQTLEAELREEAQDLGMARQLENFRDAYHYLAALDRRAHGRPPGEAP
jgi:hypothetical protein